MRDFALGSAPRLCGVYNESCQGLVIPSCLKQRLVLRFFVDAEAALGTNEVYNESCQGLVIPSALLLVVGVLHAAFASLFGIGTLRVGGQGACPGKKGKYWVCCRCQTICVAFLWLPLPGPAPWAFLANSHLRSIGGCSRGWHSWHLGAS